MAKPEIGAGDVEITLAGQQFTLKPTLQACQRISKLGAGNGASMVIERCHRLDFDTVLEVISIGLDATSGKQKQELAELIFRSGVLSVAADAILFVRVVNNGGTLPNDNDEGEDDDEVDGPLSPQKNSTTA